MSFKWIFSIGLLACLAGFTACERDDDEPFVNRDFSRLYVAFSDYTTNDQQAKPVNLGVMLRADSTNFGDVNNFQTFISATNGASAITFNPAAQRVFLSNINNSGRDTTIQIFPVGKEGNVSNTNHIANKHINKVSGLVYYASLDNLYGVDNSTSTILIYNRPKGRSGFMKVSQRFIINDDLTPWAISMFQNVIYVTRTGENGGIDVFENITGNKIDTLIENVTATRKLRISGTQNIQGMSLDTVNNILALTDYSTSGTGGTAGRILIFEKFSELASVSGTITPTRIIEGTNTGLIRPTDVELDFKESGKYIYVADPGSKKVYRYLKSADGDQKPDAEFTYKGLTPVGISLDSR